MQTTLSQSRTTPQGPLSCVPEIPDSVDPNAAQEIPEVPREATSGSFLNLVRDLNQEIRTFIRQEIKLAKTEVSEKLQYISRNSILLGIGAVTAYAGVIVLLIGLGFLAAWLIGKAGVAGLLACFLGLLFISLLVLAVGGGFVLKGVNAFRKESLAPNRTLVTLKDLRGQLPHQAPQTESPDGKEPKVSSAEMQAQVQATEGQMGETLDELARRLDPQYINEKVKRRIREKPLRAGLMAVGAGLVSGLMLRRRLRRA